MAKKSTGPFDLSSALKDLRKSIEGQTFDTSTLTNIGAYYDTGCYALNRILSGRFKGGLPSGRVAIFYGESSAGKSVISTAAAATALNTQKVQNVFLLDSEGGVSRNMYSIFNCDQSKIEHIPIDNVEDLSNKATQILTFIKAAQKEDPTYRAIVILDSLGACVPRKCFTDIEKDEQKLDRGLRARLINDFIKSINMPCLKTDTTFIVLNHIYDDPNAMYVSAIKNQGGGKGIIFMCRMMIQCTKSLTKGEAEEKAEGRIYSGTKLKFLCTKNFVVQPFHSCEIEIDFSTGYKTKYTGLLELAEKYNFVQRPKVGRLLVPSYSDKTMYERELFGPKADEIWGTFIDALDEASYEDIQYGALLQAPEESDEIDEDTIEEL